MRNTARLLLTAALALTACDDLGALTEPDEVGPRRAGRDADPPADDRDEGAAERPLDAGPRADAAPPAGDAAPAPDLDGGGGPTPPDADPPDAAPIDPGCALGPDPDPDLPRVLLVGHPFGAVPGEDGTEVSAWAVEPDGDLTPGARIDVGFRPERIAFVPSGRFALVLGEDGTLAILAVDDADEVTLIDAVGLPGAGAADLVIDPDGLYAHAVFADVDEDSGVYTVGIGCDGALKPEPPHFSLRLSDSFALVPGMPDRAVLLGGQTAFEPFDDFDLRLLARGPRGWRQVGQADLWGDFVDSAGIGIAGDGRTVLIPNGSPFSEEGGQLMVAKIEGDTLVEVTRLTGLGDLRQVRFAPDGETALVSRLEDGIVSVVADTEDGWQVVDDIGGVGLAEHLAIVQRGAQAGLVFAPSVSPADGPQLVTLQVEGPGVVRHVRTMLLGEGSPQIPGPAAVAPLNRAAAVVGDEAPVWRRAFVALLGVTALRDLLSVHVPAMALRPPDAFRLPWLPGLPVLDRTDDTLLLAHVALAAMAAAAAWMVLRPAGRWAPLTLLAGYGAAFLADQRHYTSNQYLLLWCLALVAAWGVRAPAPAWPRLALRLLFSGVYAAAVITKLDPAWLDGLVMRESLLHYGPVWGAIDDRVPELAYPVAAWATLGLEAFLVVGLWVRPLRRWAIALGVLLHVGIEIVMPVRCFSYLMLAGYVLYLDAEAVPRPSTEPAWRWLGAGLAFALAAAALGWTFELYPLPPVNLAAVGAGVAIAAGLGRRPAAERPAPAPRPALRVAALGGLVALHAALLARPYLGGDDRFAFRMFREIVVVQAETRAQVGGRWRQYPMVGATEYWFAGAPGYYWESWREHRDFLQGYADWILGASGAEDVRVVARYRINDGPVQQAVFAPRAP